MDSYSCYWVSGVYNRYFNLEDHELAGISVFIRGTTLGNFNHVYHSGRNFCLSDPANLAEFGAELISLIKRNGKWPIDS